MDGANIYLHGFTRDGRSVCQNGPYSPDQASEVEQDRTSLKRLGAHRIVRVVAADHATAAALAQESLRGPAGIPLEPWSVRDYIWRAIAMVSMKVSVAWGRWRARRRRG